MRILGISAFYHDSAAALVEDGDIVAAAQEERFHARSTTPRFPVHAVRYCLAEGGWAAKLDAVAFYDKPITQVRAHPRDVLRGRPARARSRS